MTPVWTLIPKGPFYKTKITSGLNLFNGQHLSREKGLDGHATLRSSRNDQNTSPGLKSKVV